MDLYTSPTDHSRSISGPQSCLKQQEVASPSHKTHRPQSSQVRFSLPIEENSTSFDRSVDTDEQGGSSLHKYEERPQFLASSNPPLRTDYPKIGSPSKIVYPASVNKPEELPTFVDYSNKVNVPVPKEIWDYHSKHHGSSYTNNNYDSVYVTPNGSPCKTHSRNNSLQSIILDTIETYKPKSSNCNALNLQERPVLLPNEENGSGLYLRPDSPMNKYEVPIPLQINVPPYLSPENKGKRRNSLIFDGDGYSVYLGDEISDSSNYSDIEEHIPKDCDISDISIASAENNLSFNVSDDDIDTKLGIDSDANVDLKKQVRNLKRFSIQHTQPAEIKPQRVVEDRKISPEPVNNSALEILATPSKEIIIPTIEDIPRSTTKNGTLEFFKTFSDGDDRSQSNELNGVETNRLNVNFKFPPNNDIQCNDGSFLKTPQESMKSDTENRRQVLRQSQDYRSHAHKRSRSMHTDSDMFATLSPVPNPASSKEKSDSTPEIPERSPLRPSSISSLPLDDMSNDTVSGTVGKKTDSLKSCENLEEESLQEVYEISSAYSSEEEEQFSFISSVEELPRINVFPPSQNDVVDNDSTKKEPVVQQGVTKPLNKISSPLASPKPLSTIQSFSTNIERNLEIPTSKIMAEAIKEVSRGKSLLDPSTRLSNNAKTESQSSYESEISHGSYPSMETTVTDPLLTETPAGKPIDYPLTTSSETGFSRASKDNVSYDSRNLGLNDGRKFHDSLNKNEQDYTILENHNGNMVEVIVLDSPYVDERTDSHFRRTSPETKRKSAEIVDLCEQTAEDIKDLILELTTSDKKYSSRARASYKSLPPLPQHLLNGPQLSQQRHNMSPENQRRYMERIQGMHR
ncbi:unnamed protein product [Kluyveromyces dobzhanskii CBS 2104]|uniref:WGS project CCBQ000000000 data, contig 00105 n=1 Tax=Kluyveromyces dobzhanskii CBS 2104 TaxID=1427455 RepID=A0A0A8KZM8_9SACH|nr:unnamed protein product [Kluyveromyces dobzhanskii CBS 2104]